MIKVMHFFHHEHGEALEKAPQKNSENSTLWELKTLPDEVMSNPAHLSYFGLDDFSQLLPT